MIPGSHGGRRIELERSGVNIRADFSASINPWGPPEVLKERWGELLRLVEAYPPLDWSLYRKPMAALYGYDPDFILPCNGATQGIYLLSRLLAAQRILVLEPLFTEYARAFELSGKVVFRFSLFPAFERDHLVKMIQAKRIEALVFGNPSNPLGEVGGVSLYRYLREAGFSDLTVIVDEAFQEFMGEETSLSEAVRKDRNLYLVRSLTKYYAIPGLRGGFVLTHPDNVATLERYLEPWSCNGILWGVLELLSAADLSSFHGLTRENLRREKDFLETQFRRFSSLLEWYPSRVNFYTFRVKEKPGDFFRFLCAEGILVRSLAEFFGLGEGFFRLAVRRREENELFFEVVEEFARKL
ncbi:MAG: aminotransferase class I/II-fold pyridoxal phosphate-dependent enzyme [Candidatus Atribacteria bacterium]|nr:aminotransferase class I/II-fold pyridoxal phosphate-dependent enzyme [Candidatus Atribacteria bacterium]